MKFFDKSAVMAIATGAIVFQHALMKRITTLRI